MTKMKIKEKYKTLYHNGITYHLGNMNEEKLQRVWETNPDLRYAFEEEPVKFDEGLLDIGIDTPEKFDAQIKKVVSTRTKKK